MLDVCSKTQNAFNEDQKRNNMLYEEIDKIQNHRTKVTEKMSDYRLEVEHINSIYYSPQTIQYSLKETAVSDQNNNLNFTDATLVKKIKDENFRVSCFIAKNRTKIVAN